MLIALVGLLAACQAAPAAPATTDIVQPTPIVIYVTPAPTPTGAPTPTLEPTAPPTPTPVAHDLTVRFTLTDYGGSIDGVPDNCYGSGGYSDFQTGLQVNVNDGSGTLVGFGTFTDSEGETYGESGNYLIKCTITALVEDLPDLPVYSIEVGRRGAINFTRAELAGNGWVAELTLGD